MRNPILPAVLASLLAAAPAHAGGPVVVELFTSQGCSSCPPADAWLDKVSAGEDVIALSMHVDYWDYLGWRDTFASEATTARQFAYRNAAGNSTVWTPQVVVQGRPGRPGEGQPDIEAAIARAAEEEPAAGIGFEQKDGMSYARLEPAAGGSPAVTVWVVAYDRESTVRIERGENRGREITYRNVVTAISRIGEWDGAHPLDISVPNPGPGEGVAVILQDAGAGPILAAGRLEN